MSFNVKLSLTGDKALDRKFGKLATRMQKSIMKKAARAGTKSIKKAVTSTIPVDRGTWKKSIGVKVKQLRNGPAFAAVGHDTKFRVPNPNPGKPNTFRPSNYAHLVERGTKRSRPNPIFRRAFEVAKQQAANDMQAKIKSELKKVI